MVVTQLPPGPKGRWPLGSLPELSRDLLGFFERLARDYGAVAQVPVLGGSFFALMQPGAVEEVLVRQAGSFALQHKGIMDRGEQSLTVTVVPDSGTRGLAGLSGRMKIEISGGKHFYELEYELGADA